MKFRRAAQSRSLRFTISQAMGSAATFAITLAFSRGLPIRDYGQLAFALTFVYFVVSFQRAIIGDPLLVYNETNGKLVRAATVWVSIVGFGTGFLIWLASLFFEMPLAPMLPLIGAVVVVQDGLRYVSFAAGRLGSLFFFDLAWVIAAFVLFALHAFGHVAIDLSAAFWLIGCLIVALFHLVKSLFAFRRKRYRRRFFAYTRKVSTWSGMQFLVANGVGQTSLSLIVAAVGAADFAGYRAVQTVISPLVVGVLALSSPLISRVTAYRLQDKWSYARTLKFALALVGALAPIAIVAFLNREYLIRVLPGSQYEPYSNLVLPALIGLVLVAANLPISASMLAMMRGRALFIASVAATIPTAIITVLAAYSFGIEGAAWAMTFQYGMILVCGIIALFELGPSTKARRPGSGLPMRHVKVRA